MEDSAAEAAARRARLLRNHIRRSTALQADVVTRERLRRELHGLRGCWADVVAAAWGTGVVDKGSVSFVPSFARARWGNMPCVYVGGEDDKTGLGVAYASECIDGSGRVELC